MDEIDISQEQQEVELQRLITAHACSMPKGESARECLECGDPIPEDRRKAQAGCRFCLSCQEQLELQQRGRR